MARATRSLDYLVEDSGPVDGKTMDERRLYFRIGGAAWEFKYQKRLSILELEEIRVGTGEFLSHWNAKFLLESVTEFYKELSRIGYWRDSAKDS